MLRLKAGVHLCFALILFLCLSGSGTAAEVPDVTGEVKSDGLRLEEAIRTALKYHPKIKGAEEEVGAQRAVVGQSLSAYYPEISFNNFYRSTLSSGQTSSSQSAFDFLSSRTDFDMTLYDFGKREGKLRFATSPGRSEPKYFPRSPQNFPQPLCMITMAPRGIFPCLFSHVCISIFCKR